MGNSDLSPWISSERQSDGREQSERREVASQNDQVFGQVALQNLALGTARVHFIDNAWAPGELASAIDGVLHMMALDFDACLATKSNVIAQNSGSSTTLGRLAFSTLAFI